MIDKQSLDDPCHQCDGDRWVEVESHFEQGRTDGRIVYRREQCDHCEGSGLEPVPEPDDLGEPLHCELFDFRGEPLEHESCSYCGECLDCWFCTCSERTRERALESRIDEELAGRPRPHKMGAS